MSDLGMSDLELDSAYDAWYNGRDELLESICHLRDSDTTSRVMEALRTHNEAHLAEWAPKFCERYQTFLLDYASFMKQDDNLVPEYGQALTTAFDSEVFLEMRCLYRSLRYAESGVFETWDGAQVTDLRHKSTIDSRTLVAARILWIEKRQANNLECYPEQGRYTDLESNIETLMQELSPARRWVLDWAIVPPIELHALMFAIYKVHESIYEVVDLLGDSSHLDTGLKIMVEDITTLCSDEELKSTDNTCHICFGELGESEELESGIKTICEPVGHILGKSCLQKWIDEGKVTCPMCRGSLIAHDAALSVTSLLLYGRLRQLQRREASLDAENDSFFLGECKEVYGEQMKQLLEKLEEIYDDASSLRDTILAANEADPTNDVVSV